MEELCFLVLFLVPYLGYVFLIECLIAALPEFLFLGRQLSVFHIVIFPLLFRLLLSCFT